MSLKVNNPSSFVLAGYSGVGKTYWIFRFIDHIGKIISPKLEKILYFYEIWQPTFQDYMHKVQFIQGMPDLETLRTPERKIVILDDLMHEDSMLLSKIFTIYSHHYNFTVIETVQNLFHKSHREIYLNAQFVVLFKNCRDVNQIACFLRQAFPDKHKAVLEAYINPTSGGRGYLLLDFCCDTDDKERIRTQIFPDEVNYIYQ